MAQGVEAFQGWLRSLEVVPTILALRNRMEEIRKGEVDKALSLFKNVSDDERKALDLLTNSIINKILHHPISLLKHQKSRDHGKIYVEMTRKIFRLDEEDNEPSASSKMKFGWERGPAFSLCCQANWVKSKLEEHHPESG